MTVRALRQTPSATLCLCRTSHVGFSGGSLEQPPAVSCRKNEYLLQNVLSCDQVVPLCHRNVWTHMDVDITMQTGHHHTPYRPTAYPASHTEHNSKQLQRLHDVLLQRRRVDRSRKACPGVKLKQLGATVPPCEFGPRRTTFPKRGTVQAASSGLSRSSPLLQARQHQRV